MKQIFSTVLILILCFSAKSQTTITGKIDSLKDAWGETITYVGEIKGGKPNGLGLAIYHNDYALRYAGYFVNGKYEGKGALVFTDGSFLSGTWKAGKLNGPGANFNKDRDLYVGGFLNGEKSGAGTFIYADNGFLQGNFKNDQYDGRCIFIGSDGDIISDNIYANGKKNGQGYQYEVKTKKLYEGIWKDGEWQEATSGNYNSFLKNSSFYGEKTDNQILMGIIDKSNNDYLEDTGFYYDLSKRKRYFGYNHNGFQESGITIRDDSSRFIGKINDDGAYGYCSFLKMGKYYDEGNFSKDFLSGDNCLSINIDKKTIYYGQTTGQAEFTGKAWFVSSSNDLYSGDYLDGNFTGTGWRIDKSGYCIKGTWNKGDVETITALYNDKGELINTKPKTMSDALSAALSTYKDEFIGLQGNSDYSEDYDWLYLTYESLISFPGTSDKDLIVSDFKDYWNYVATFAQTESFDVAKAKYDQLCSQVKTSSITLKKGTAPVKLSGDIVAAAENDFVISQFSLPSTIKGFDDAAVSVIIKKNDNDDYIVMVVCGDEYSASQWDEAD